MTDAEPPDDDAGPGSPPDVPAPEPSGATPAEVSPHEQRARLAEDRLAEVMAAYRALKQENEIPCVSKSQIGA